MDNGGERSRVRDALGKVHRLQIRHVNVRYPRGGTVHKDRRATPTVFVVFDLTLPRQNGLIYLPWQGITCAGVSTR